MPELIATVYPDEAYVLVQADWAGTLLRQNFSVPSASNWPTADTGQTFTPQSGVAADFTSSGGKGVITHSAVGTTKRISADGLSVLDFDSSGVYTNITVPAGGGTIEVGFGGRFVDANNRVEVRMFFSTAGTTTFSIRQVVGGVETNGGFPALPTIPVTGVYRWRFRGVGSSLFFRVWMDGSAEPQIWNGTFTTTWLTAGTATWTTTVGGAITNPVPISFLFDNLIVIDPNAVMTDCAIVTRRNTVTGETVFLRPYVFYDENGSLILECGQGLWWDTEPPLNVELEYCTIACDSPVAMNINPTFESGTTGWTATGGALTQDCTVAKIGACSGRLTPTGSSADPFLLQTGFPLVAGIETTVSAWVRSSQGWNGVRLRLQLVYTDFLTEDISTPIEILDDLEWRYLSVTFVPRTAVSSTTLRLTISGTPANTNLFNVDSFQVTQMTPVPATDCETVTVESDSVWLKSPLHPCDDIEIGLCSPMLPDCDEDSRVSYVGTYDDSYSPNTVLLGPVNRRHPIPINRIRRDAAATLRLLAHDCDAKDAVLQANEPGSPLLFQAPADYCIPDRYISVGVMEETRISVDQRLDFRLMTLPYVTVARPEGPMDGPCGARIDDLCDIYTSWAAMGIAGLTWTDLLLGEASPDGPGQPEPPAGARTWDEVEAEFTDWDDVEAGGTRDWDELRDGL